MPRAMITSSDIPILVTKPDKFLFANRLSDFNFADYTNYTDLIEGAILKIEQDIKSGKLWPDLSDADSILPGEKYEPLDFYVLELRQMAVPLREVPYVRGRAHALLMSLSNLSNLLVAQHVSASDQTARFYQWAAVEILSNHRFVNADLRIMFSEFSEELDKAWKKHRKAYSSNSIYPEAVHLRMDALLLGGMDDEPAGEQVMSEFRDVFVKSTSSDQPKAYIRTYHTWAKKRREAKKAGQHTAA